MENPAAFHPFACISGDSDTNSDVDRNVHPSLEDQVRQTNNQVGCLYARLVDKIQKLSCLNIILLYL